MSQLTELIARMPGVKRLEKSTVCWHSVMTYISPWEEVHYRFCLARARWEYDQHTWCWQHLWLMLKAEPFAQRWILIRLGPHTHIDMTEFNQAQADMDIVFCSLTGQGPAAEMASDWFDHEVDEAYERLTPRQRALVMNYALGRGKQ
jgi:hypothetical protein